MKKETARNNLQTVLNALRENELTTMQALTASGNEALCEAFWVALSDYIGVVGLDTVSCRINDMKIGAGARQKTESLLERPEYSRDDVQSLVLEHMIRKADHFLGLADNPLGYIQKMIVNFLASLLKDKHEVQPGASLDALVGNGDSTTTLGSFLPSTEYSPEELAEAKESVETRKKTIKQAILKFENRPEVLLPVLFEYVSPAVKNDAPMTPRKIAKLLMMYRSENTFVAMKQHLEELNILTDGAPEFSGIKPITDHDFRLESNDLDAVTLRVSHLLSYAHSQGFGKTTKRAEKAKKAEKAGVDAA